VTTNKEIKLTDS